MKWPAWWYRLVPYLGRRQADAESAGGASAAPGAGARAAARRRCAGGRRSAGGAAQARQRGTDPRTYARRMGLALARRPGARRAPRRPRVAAEPRIRGRCGARAGSWDRCECGDVSASSTPSCYSRCPTPTRKPSCGWASGSVRQVTRTRCACRTARCPCFRSMPSRSSSSPPIRSSLLTGPVRRVRFPFPAPWFRRRCSRCCERRRARVGSSRTRRHGSGRTRWHCSATAPGSGTSARTRTSWGRRSFSRVTRTPSSACLPRASTFRTGTSSSGCPTPFRRSCHPARRVRESSVWWSCSPSARLGGFVLACRRSRRLPKPARYCSAAVTSCWRKPRARRQTGPKSTSGWSLCWTRWSTSTGRRYWR